MIATAQPASGSGRALAPLEGWWRAPLEHGGDTNEIFLLFERRGNKLIARFSAPAITADRSGLGYVASEGDKVRIIEAEWDLQRSPDGETLTTTVPATLIPTYAIKARFQRSAAPVQPVLPEPLQAAPKPIWKAALGQAIVGGIAADTNGRMLFVAGKAGRLAAIAADGGRIRWTRDLGAPVRSAPLAAGRALFVATDNDLQRVDPGTGTIVWRQPFGKPLHPILEIDKPHSRWDHYSASPVVHGGVVYAGSRDGCLHGFAAASGRQQLKFCTKDAITAAPVVSGGLVYVGSFDHYLYAVRAKDGSLVWKKDLAEPITRDLALVAGAVVAGSRSYDLRAFDAATGATRWNRYIWFSWIDSAPSAQGALLTIGSSDAQRVFAMDAAKGRSNWSSFIGGWAWAKPAIGRTIVYAGAVGTTMRYVGRRQGALVALNRDSGALRWLFRPSFDPKDLIWGFAADPIVIRDRLFAADLGGTVYAFPAA